jgi:hypothetical protein
MLPHLPRARQLQTAPALFSFNKEYARGSGLDAGKLCDKAGATRVLPRRRKFSSIESPVAATCFHPDGMESRLNF